MAALGVYLLRENPLGPGRQHTRLDVCVCVCVCVCEPP